MKPPFALVGLVFLAAAAACGSAAGRAAPPPEGKREPAPASRTVIGEVVVYGGTPSGIMAAVAAARHGRTVALLEPSNHVGGVVSGGLVDTDTGDRATIGGLADDFLKRILTFYREKYGADSKQFAACKNGLKYEPHVAEKVFEDMLKEQPRITVWKRHRLRSLALAEKRITSLTADDLAGGVRTFNGEVFIDASYVGDLMPAARVPYRVGREGARSTANTWPVSARARRSCAAWATIARRLTIFAPRSPRAPRTAFSFPGRNSTTRNPGA